MTPTPPAALVSSTPTDLLVVVVNYRTPDLTLACLRSLSAEVACAKREGVSITAAVVDNASGDGSADALSRALRDGGWSGPNGWCTLICSSKNLGFSGGNNLAIKPALASGSPPRYVLLLNSDTVVHPGALIASIKRMDADSTIGALSCKLLNADGSLQVVARPFPTLGRSLLGLTPLPWRLPRVFGWARGEYRGWDMSSTAGDADWIGGAFMMLRSSLLQQVGSLDESFFFYGEDIEICWRIWRSGHRCRYDPVVSITHLGAGSSDPSRLNVQTRGKFAWDARYRVQRKLSGPLGAWLLRCADLAAVGTRYAAHRLLRRDDEHTRSLARAWGIITGRAQK